jgi:alpha-tubulin suppressor-like RCC1 family protein
LYAWGANKFGQLGDGTATTRLMPVSVSGLSSDVTDISAGYFHSLAVVNSAAFAWGSNDTGQLGDGTSGALNQRTPPVAVTGLPSGVTGVAAGKQYHSLAIVNAGLYAWGANGYGQLGDGTIIQRDTPVAITGFGSGASAVAVGSAHSLAVKNGLLYAWGTNGQGQLGDGTRDQRTTPVLVTDLSSGVTAIAAGWDHNLAIVNGAVYAWGFNRNFALGLGSFGNRDRPVQVDPANLTNIVAVAAGLDASYALSSDGSLWVWGSNRNGQLGLEVGSGSGFGGILHRTPEHLLPPAGYKFTSIAAGYGHAVAMLRAIPEPSTFVLAAAGLLALTFARRRRFA